MTCNLVSMTFQRCWKYTVEKIKVKKYIAIIVLIPSIMLTGCASIMNGTHQKVTVTTPPTTGAHCSLHNRKGKWVVRSTPGTVRIHRDRKALYIRCYKHGYRHGSRAVKSEMKGSIAGSRH